MPPTILVSPAEPRQLRELGTNNLVTERHGVDFMWMAQGQRWGVQRKEIGDLIASIRDGRLAQELGQMQQLDVAMLIVEGRLNWTSEGELIAEHWTTVSRRQFQAMLWSIQQRGCWVERTDTMTHTADTIRWFADWSTKPRHGGMRGRPKPQGNWGHISDREWGIHLLTSFPGIGVGTAEAIYDHFDGVPIAWDVTEKELTDVKGVGKKRAADLIKTLKQG